MVFKDDETLLVNALTPEEQMALIEDWDRYDVDQSGTVTKTEFLNGETAWFKRVYGTDISKDDLEEKLVFWERTRDKDGSGEVSWNEYSESKAMLILDQRGGLVAALTREEKEDAMAAFKVIDKDGSGCISESEARSFFEKRAIKDVENGLRTAKAADIYVEKQTKMLFFFKDNDHSGTVDFDEFLAEEAKNIIGDRFTDNKNSLSSEISRDKQGTVQVESGDGPVSILTEEQIEHAKMKFQDWDTDSSDGLSVKELQSITKDLNLKITAKQFRGAIKKAFKQHDTDGDKNLSFEEFLPIYNLLYLSEMNFDDF